jgi:hypothetical protein
MYPQYQHSWSNFGLISRGPSSRPNCSTGPVAAYRRRKRSRCREAFKYFSPKISKLLPFVPSKDSFLQTSERLVLSDCKKAAAHLMHYHDTVKWHWIIILRLISGNVLGWVGGLCSAQGCQTFLGALHQNPKMNQTDTKYTKFDTKYAKCQ